jgi:hypothetical protein
LKYTVKTYENFFHAFWLLKATPCPVFPCGTGGGRISIGKWLKIEKNCLPPLPGAFKLQLSVMSRHVARTEVRPPCLAQ